MEPAPSRLVTLLQIPLALLFGCMWIYAGWQKVTGLAPITFLDDIRSFHILNDPWAAWVAMGLPWLEIICGVCVIFCILYRGALVILVTSLIVFLIAIASAWQRGIDITCGCFGKAESASSPLQLIVRDLVLLAIGLVLLAFSGRYRPWRVLAGRLS